MPPLAADAPQPDDPAPMPSDGKLLSFLRLKLAGEALPAAAGAHFHDCDIYAADPATLTAGYLPAPTRKGEGYSWFFFTFVRPKSNTDSRKKRMVGGGAGTWHSERAPRAVLDGEGSCVGHTQYFSYKRKTGSNCNERTDWYMLEFTDGPEGGHDRIHGGEPVLVLCKIYKAHSGSRSSSSSSSSRSARKRKATEDHAHPSSAAVKAKRRLFSSSAPTQLPASLEQVSSTATMVTPRLESHGKAAQFEQDAYDGKTDDLTVDDILFLESEFQTHSTSDCLNFSTNPEASQQQVSCRVILATSGLQLQSEVAEVEPEAYHAGTDDDTVDHILLYWESQCKTNNTSDYQKISPNPEGSTSQSKTSAIIPSSLMSDTEISQAKIGGTSDYLRFWPEPEAPQGMINTTSDYQFSPEEEAAEKITSTTPPSLVMSESGMTAQGKISGTTDYIKLWTGLETSQGMINRTSPSSLTSEPWMKLSFESEPKASEGKSEYLNFSPKTKASQKTNTTPRSTMMLEPEAQVPQGEGEKSALDWGIQTAGIGTTPVPVQCNDNSTTPSWSCGLGWFVGAPPNYDLWSSTGFPCSPSMFGSPTLWSY